MSQQPEAATLADEAIVPDAVARILATTVVATLMGGAVTKVFGKKAGIVAFLVSAAAHEMFDAPLARRLSRLGL